jgi:hypothetical protein
MDLAGMTVTMNPPRKPEKNEGYFELIKGPVPPVGTTFAVNTDNANQPDPTVGNFGDILMFTTRSTGRPFVGRFLNNTIQSDVAEVAWFVRGRTLHRRVLLVAPGILDPGNEGILQSHSELGLGLSNSDQTGYYAAYDVSVRAAYDAGGTFQGYTPNTLGDLTRRECRFAHSTAGFPFAVGWSWTTGTVTMPTLPTLNECSYSTWKVDQTGGSLAPNPLPTLDFWTNNPIYRIADNAAIGGGVNHGSRIADDVILTNVIGFDVKAWEPDSGSYVDLGHAGVGRFSAASNVLVDPARGVRLGNGNVYDTWSTHYETVGTGLTGDVPGQSVNGLDEAGAGIVDSDADKLTSPPYPYPLRGIQVKIRTFEPDSRQIREWTVVQDFLPQ